ncbi:Uncharacterised protein [Mycolicibacterium vanbaalenii]|uniref:Secreted protein n=1 Tax=Mycolicibacterium vanbaalenii TaxID=110539 RepID=A0A5S9P085_MYCVN|nr:hypothetical protein [Mycolicibacterium vanbaalenii]CAA0096457.1 Uncharacterised protein [Mycolicibacterium vanbaalenii]
MIGSKHPEGPRGGRMKIARSRGAASGFLLILLGAWGALIPFVGPYFDFAFSPDRPWAWTNARGWLEVLPGVVVVAGGLILLASRNRAAAMLGSWLAVAGGAWFVVGRALAGPLGLGDAGTPVAAAETKQVWLELTYFYGLGAVVVFLGALGLGRLSVRSVRDVEYAQRPLESADHGVSSDHAVTGDTGPQTVVSDDTSDDASGDTATAGHAADHKATEGGRSWRNMFRGDRRDRTLSHH